MVTPVEAQRALVGRILSHWTEGAGRQHNDDRTNALSSVRVVATLDAARAAIPGDAQLVLTSARQHDKAVSFQDFRSEIAGNPGRPRLLVFGTGWGLAPGVFESADRVLEPIRGAAGYNHLSVRSAAAIVLDRLYGIARVTA